MKILYPTQECKHCCKWAEAGKSVCAYHSFYKPRESK